MPVGYMKLCTKRPQGVMMIDLDSAVLDIIANANKYRQATPTLGTLLEEVTEHVRALEGPHAHSPEHELIQIGGIALHLLRQRYADLDGIAEFGPAAHWNEEGP